MHGKCNLHTLVLHGGVITCSGCQCTPSGRLSMPSRGLVVNLVPSIGIGQMSVIVVKGCEQEPSHAASVAAQGYDLVNLVLDQTFLHPFWQQAIGFNARKTPGASWRRHTSAPWTPSGSQIKSLQRPRWSSWPYDCRTPRALSLLGTSSCW